jgi:hypothetical protein
MGCSCLVSIRVLVTLKAGGTSGAPSCCQSEAQRCLQRDHRRAYRRNPIMKALSSVCCSPPRFSRRSRSHRK